MKPERAGDYVGHMVEAIDRIATYLEGAWTARRSLRILWSRMR